MTNLRASRENRETESSGWNSALDPVQIRRSLSRKRYVSPHLHGVVAIDAAERKLANPILREVAGKFYEPRKLRLTIIPDAVNWGSYCAKDIRTTRRLIPGSAFTVTRSLSRRARETYEIHRSAFALLKSDRERPALLM